MFHSSPFHTTTALACIQHQASVLLWCGLHRQCVYKIYASLTTRYAGSAFTAVACIDPVSYTEQHMRGAYAIVQVGSMHVRRFAGL